jgi:hypothetical protein
VYECNDTQRNARYSLASPPRNQVEFAPVGYVLENGGGSASSQDQSLSRYHNVTPTRVVIERWHRLRANLHVFDRVLVRG